MNTHVDIILMSTRAFIMLVPGLAYLCGVWSLLVQGWSLAFRVDYLSVGLDLDTPWPQKHGLCTAYWQAKSQVVIW